MAKKPVARETFRETFVCDMLVDEEASVVLGRSASDVLPCVMGPEEIVVPSATDLRLRLDYKLPKKVTLSLHSTLPDGGFTRWDIMQKILIAYRAQGKQYDAVLHSLLLRADGVYTIGCDS